MPGPLLLPSAHAGGWQGRFPTLACSSQSARHFKRPSLYYRGLSEPADVLQHCLTLFRSARVANLLPYLASPPHNLEPRACTVDVGGVQVQETGPLAPLAGTLDVGARRVLPGHLLRRSRVLSTLRLGDSFKQRVALTACTGEESVFEWSLQRVPSGGGSISEEEEPSASAAQVLPLAGSAPLGTGMLQQAQQAQHDQQAERWGSDAGSRSDDEGGGGRWVVVAVQRDGSCDSPLPTTPHPKSAPESVVKAQLAALQRADLFEASSFNIWKTRTSGFGLGIHYQLLREKLEDPRYAGLLHHADAWLGAGALPSQRVMLQEVVVVTSSGGGGGGGRGERGGGGQLGGAGAARFLWRLGMQANGCWQVTGISCLDSF